MKRLIALLLSLVMLLSVAAVPAMGEDLAAAAKAIKESKTYENTYNT